MIAFPTPGPHKKIEKINNSVWRRAQELWVQNCSIGHGQDGLFFASNRTVVQYNILYQVPCWDRCLRQRRFQVRLPVVWESSGSRLGAVWEPSGSRLGVAWESSGRRLGDVGRRRKMAPKSTQKCKIPLFLGEIHQNLGEIH